MRTSRPTTWRAFSSSFFALAVVILAQTPACGGSTGTNLFGPEVDGDGGGGGVGSGTDPGTQADGGDADGGGDRDGGDKPCVGLECEKAACKPGEKTTLRGKVYDPAGANALYNVRVFVPAAGPLPALPNGASCDPCGGAITPKPIVETRTNAKGEFVLEDVPVVGDLPIVVQTGKWRRQVKVAVSKACQENAVADKTLRLPKNGSEGDMPHIAVTAGGCDALECLLRGIGIDDAEFVAGATPLGHVHVFNGDGGEFPGGPLAGDELWNSSAKMSPYDAVLLSCECSERNDTKGGNAVGARQSMHDYADMGGRVMATHFHNTWFQNSPQPDWRQIANWGASGAASGAYTVDTSSPAGVAFATWLVAVNASNTAGSINLADVTSSVGLANPPAQTWIKSSTAATFFTFPAPTTGAACGRAAFSDLHVMGLGAGGQVFPGGCPSAGKLNAQQKALEFLLFEMSACAK